jgi:hypothetical protein
LNSELLRRLIFWSACSLAGVVLLLSSAVVELAGICVAAWSIIDSLGGTMGLGVLVAAGAATLLSALAIHELGHLVAGWFVGMTPLMAHLGPLVLRPVDGRWRLRWDGSQSLIAARAFCSFHRIARQRVIFYLLGGCLANLALFLAIVPALFFLTGPARGLGLLLAVHTLVACLSSLIPIHLLGLDTDGLAVAKLLARRPWTIANFQPHFRSV